MCNINKKAIEKCLTSRFYPHLLSIEDEDIIVEIDESKFEKVKYHRGHRADEVWVLGMVERILEKRIILIPIEYRRKKKNSIFFVEALH